MYESYKRHYIVLIASTEELVGLKRRIWNNRLPLRYKFMFIRAINLEQSTHITFKWKWKLELRNFQKLALKIKEL
jgi:hypothetical protein